MNRTAVPTRYIITRRSSDALGIKPLSEFCGRQKGVLQLLFEILDGGGEEAAVLRRWVSA